MSISVCHPRLLFFAAMAETHLEKLIRTEMAKITKATMTVSLVDPLKGACDLARLQGRYSAFEETIAMQRRAAQKDAEDDGV